MERETSVSGELEGEMDGELEGDLCDSLGLDLSGSSGLEFCGSSGLDSVWDSVCGFLAGKTWRESKESWVWMGEREGEIRL